MTNARAKRNDRIDRLMEQTAAAKRAKDAFDAERFAAEALALSFRALDMDRMQHALEELREARESLRVLALRDGSVRTIGAGGGDPAPASGCWLIEPPRVGAEARALRDASLDARCAALVVCREPLTQTGLWPIVCVGPSVVRTKVTPPRKMSVEWFVETVEAVGAAAVDEVDSTLPAIERLETLFERLQCVPDSLTLHEAVAQACRDAAREDARDAAGGRGRTRRLEADDEMDAGAA